MKSRKHSGSTKATAKISARAPRRCHRCPNYPLKATCGCSKRSKVLQGPESQLGSGESWGRPLPGELPGIETSQDDMIGPVESTTPAYPGIRTRREQTSDIGESAQMVIDPVLLGAAGSTPQTPGVRTASEAPENDPGEQSGDVGSDSGTPDVEGAASKRLTTVEKGVAYGLVDGVMRGNTVYRIVRHNKKRKPIPDASSATTRYNRELPRIISKAERLALETDAYVLILAQQATGSSATVHFASERLRREAFDDSAKLVNGFQTLMTQLVMAKRSTVFALAQNLQASEKARAEAEGKLLENKNVVASTTAALLDKEAELAASRNANEELVLELEALRDSMRRNSLQRA